MDEILFDSMHDALMFAFRYNCQQFTPSIIARMMKGPIASGKGLGGLDGAAQAGMILAMVENLDPYEKSMITAKYSNDQAKIIQAQMTLIPPVMACLPTGMHSRRAADVLIQRWFGARIPMPDIAKLVCTPSSTIYRHWAAIKQTLGNILDRAEGNAHSELQRAGIIQ